MLHSWLVPNYCCIEIINLIVTYMAAIITSLTWIYWHVLFDLSSWILFQIIILFLGFYVYVGQSLILGMLYW